MGKDVKKRLKVEYLPISALVEYENNAKIHTAEQVGQIKESIERFGMCDPIAVWGENIIVEGHGRLLALQELGQTEAPVIRLDHLSDEERRAYGLVHNKLTMNTGFDEGLLQVELDGIEMDMSDFGFEELEDEPVFEPVKEEKPEIEFTEVLGEEHNYIVLYFDNEIDWLQAESVFDIEPKLNLSTRKDGKVPKGMERISVGRVLNGAMALERLRAHYEDQH